MKIVKVLPLFILLLGFSIYSSSIADAASRIMWGKTELKPGQIGKVTILTDTILVKIESDGSLTTIRSMKKGEEYRVYSYKSNKGGLYGLGGGSFVQKNEKVKYETPSKSKLALLKVGNKNESKKKQDSTNINDNLDGTRIKLSFNNEEVIVKMFDNPTSRDFITLLPLTLTFEDYARTEKISYPTNKLSTEKALPGIDPKVGDFCYYAPWGNLAIYYKDFGYSTGLIKLGEIESGIEKLENLNGNFKVTVERID